MYALSIIQIPLLSIINYPYTMFTTHLFVIPYPLYLMYNSFCSIINYVLSDIYYPLPLIRCPLSASHYPLYIRHCPWQLIIIRYAYTLSMTHYRTLCIILYLFFIINYQLFVIHYLLPIVHYGLLLIVLCPLSAIHYPLFRIHYPLSVVHA